MSTVERYRKGIRITAPDGLVISGFGDVRPCDVYRVMGTSPDTMSLEPAPELEDLRRRLDEALAAAKRHKADADAARSREFELQQNLTHTIAMYEQALTDARGGRL